MTSRHYLCAALLGLLLTCALRVQAIDLGYRVQLSVSRSVIVADGKQTLDISAAVFDSSGRPVGNNVNVDFQTSSGTLSQPRASTLGGIARVRLTSSPVAGYAQITAIAAGGSNDHITVEFTNDPQATFEGNSYMAFSGPGYLAYSATDRVIEDHGSKEGPAKLTFRNTEISADSLQLHCDDLIVRAQSNITLKMGKHTIQALRLYYSLQSRQGYAVADVNGKLETVKISQDLQMQRSETVIPSSYFQMPELQVKLIIVAKSIYFFPGDRLQFRAPRFYQDQQQIMKLPYYELALNSQELFSDQFISLGSSGLGLELPFYYNMTPVSKGIIYLRHQQQLGSGFYSTNPGWSIDMIQDYSAQGGHRYEGAFGFTGLTRSNWGFRWNHNQQWNSATQSAFDVEFPNHQGIFTSADFTQQAHTIRWGANFAGGQTWISSPETDMQSNVYVETQPHPFLKTMQYSVGTSVTNGMTHISGTTINQTTENVSFRAFSRPRALDRRTTFTNSFTVGQLWSSTGANGPMALATLSLDHTMSGGSNLNVTYDMVLQPHTLDSLSGNHRLSVTYTQSVGKRFAASFYGSSFLDSNDDSVLADAAYRLDSRWRILAAATLQRFAGDSYKDLEFSLGRRIGARELQFTYSTYYKRFSVDLTATRF